MATANAHSSLTQDQLHNWKLLDQFQRCLAPRLAGAGLLLRRYSAAHKRLLLLATVCLLDAGYGRWTNDWFIAKLGDNPVGFFGQLFFCVNCTIVIAMLYDLWTRKTVHLAYVAAVPFIVLTQVAAE